MKQNKNTKKVGDSIKVHFLQRSNKYIKGLGTVREVNKNKLGVIHSYVVTGAVMEDFTVRKEQ